MDDADPAFLGECDREPGFRDRIHGGGHDRDVEGDVAGEAGLEADVARQDGRVRGDEQDVVERQGLGDQAHLITNRRKAALYAWCGSGKITGPDLPKGNFSASGAGAR